MQLSVNYILYWMHEMQETICRAKNKKTKRSGRRTFEPNKKPYHSSEKAFLKNKKTQLLQHEISTITDRTPTNGQRRNNPTTYCCGNKMDLKPTNLETKWLKLNTYWPTLQKEINYTTILILQSTNIDATTGKTYLTMVAQMGGEVGV